ncbi:VOC family protein [uncultured Gelidibacter sp.]|uniref:VOC family protein n=1 Tax=uncultured Gelidibacter sp. TaxID=259318 RepID=UPI00261CCDB3|nr:VOC family protein [uncultured Gelidibacter sp.]
MATVNVYLTFDGTCEAAFNFYRSVFGGEFQHIGRFTEMPKDENCASISEEDGNKIMHVSLPISSASILMGSDAAGGWAPNLIHGNNFSVSISAESKAEADTLFDSLSEGGTLTMPMAKTFWGSYFGMFTDKFGINWMVNFDEHLPH